jgi:hypothetical protein
MLAGGFGGYVAWRQWRTAQDRLRLDLFEKRLAIYTATMKFLASILTSGRVDRDEEHLWSIAVREAKWLLNRDLEVYFYSELRARALRHEALTEALKPVPPGEERSKMVHDQSKLFEWFQSQYDVIDAKFAPFLQLRH